MATKEEGVERRLVAILAADVAGYAGLMSTDEEGVLRLLKALTAEIIDPAIVEHRGRTFNTSGDGLVVEFHSVVDAMRCATNWQRNMARHNAPVSADSRIVWRIGVHLGDVIIDGTDRHGDGVNTAARLEALAEPGGICVSARVQEEVVDRLDLTFEDYGEQRLRHIPHPVHVYQISPNWLAGRQLDTNRPGYRRRLGGAMARRGAFRAVADFFGALLGLRPSDPTDTEETHERTERLIEDNEILADLNALRSDRCPLFAKAASDLFNEVKYRVSNLLNDRVEIRYTEQMSECLEQLFCDIGMITEIFATSHGEIKEWRDDNEGWMLNYLRIHKRSIENGKKITRIFIVTSESDEAENKDIFENNKRTGISVKTVLRRRISNYDFNKIGNCVIFCNTLNEPIYCLQASHTIDGEFETATIYRDQQHMRQLVEAYKRVDANATQH
jgi:class 3 adenylate cyclase